MANVSCCSHSSPTGMISGGDIIQGSNRPLGFTFDEEFDGLDLFSAELFQKNTLIKKWTIDDITIQDGVMYLPLKESETMELNGDDLVLDAKGYKNGNIIFAQLIRYSVMVRKNKERFEIEGRQ